MEKLRKVYQKSQIKKSEEQLRNEELDRIFNRCIYRPAYNAAKRGRKRSIVGGGVKDTNLITKNYGDICLMCEKMGLILYTDTFIVLKVGQTVMKRYEKNVKSILLNKKEVISDYNTRLSGNFCQHYFFSYIFDIYCCCFKFFINGINLWGNWKV